MTMLYGHLFSLLHSLLRAGMGETNPQQAFFQGAVGPLDNLKGASEEITNTSPLTLTRDQLPVDVNSNQAMPIGHPIDLRPRPLLIFHSLPLAFGTAIPELRLRGVIFLELSPRVFSDSAQSHLARFMFVESRISPNPAQ